MARTRTRLQVRDAARALADQVNGTFVTDAQANFWINQSYNALFEKIVNADPNHYVTETSVAATAGTKAYALPSDFYKLRYVDLLSGSERLTVEPYHLSEKNRYQWRGLHVAPSSHTHVRYQLIGSNLTFEPDPGTNTYYLGYVQLFTEMTDDADTFDGVAGWEEWVICDVARRMMQKEEADPTFVLAEMRALEERIDAMARDRDMSRAPQIARTRRSGHHYWHR